MKICYLIIAHHQPAHLARLIRALDTSETHFIVHVDAKAAMPGFDTIKSEKVAVLKNPVYHGGFSLARAMINLLQAAHAHHFDYYIYLSGSDYPIKSNEYIHDFLEEHLGTNFVNFYPLVDGAQFVKRIRTFYIVDFVSHVPRITRKALNVFLRIINSVLPDRKFVEGVVPFRGSQWMCLHKDTVAYIVNCLESETGKRIMTYYRFCWGADEMLFHTIVLNSPFAERCRYFKRDLEHSHSSMKNENKAYLHYVDWDRAREDPAILNESDLDKLKSCEFLFARKFDEVRSAKVLEAIDRHLSDDT